jgi:hypothetical protein
VLNLQSITKCANSSSEQAHRIEALTRALDAAAAKAETMAAALAAEIFDARPASRSDTATAASLAAN